MHKRAGAIVTMAVAALVIMIGGAGSASAAQPSPSQDPFYTYTGSTPLSAIAPGTVLKTRTLSYHVAGVPLPLSVVQLLYRTTNAQDQPSVDVTSVVKPATGGSRRVVAYQSAYDSLNPADEPSAQIAGDFTLGGIIPNVETALIAPFLLEGDTVVVDDTEGETADFAAGPEYGTDTLDSIRAALSSPATGIPSNAQVAMVGYSGGAIATEWAAQLAPTYAPDVNDHLIGAAMGGVFVDPIHNLQYVSGSLVWAGVMPMALDGLARAYGLDLTPYLSTYGAQLLAKDENASIVDVLGEDPGLTYAQLVKPQYAQPDSIPLLVQTANELIMGQNGAPTIPLMIGQGANGIIEGTPPGGPGIGAGDGVMVTGDVRSLAREYCHEGVPVQYTQYDLLSHTTSLVPWVPQALAWVAGRFAGSPPPQDCASIAPGNSLAPTPVP